MAKTIQFYPSDADLIATYKSGDGDISELYNRYANLVYGSCLKYFKNKSDADDAVSEIFLLVRDKLQIHDVNNFKSWLYTVTKNYCIEVLRKDNRSRDKISHAESMYSDAVFHPDDVVDEAQIRRLRQCIEKLPEKQRSIIEQFYYQKSSYNQISDKMNMSWNQVRSYIQNGRRNLEICVHNNEVI